jgi:hypothetical protein
MTERSRDRGFDHAVMVGNLSDLTTEQRGQYYHQVCESLVRCHKIYGSVAKTNGSVRRGW